MKRMILGLVDGQPGSITRKRSGTIDIEAERITSFDGEALITGRAAGRVTREVTVPVVTDEAISTTVEERTDRVLTDFVADLDAALPYVAIDSGDGAFLWDWLALDWGVQIERAVLDVDAIAATLRDLDTAEVWQVGWNREGGDRVGINYHRDASLRDSPRGLTQLGFAAEWRGGYFEGTIARSGYLAEFSGATTEQVAAWVRDEILPHADFPETDDQQTLDGGAD